jgi:septal ring factor EnvC (AmiA/AmiB activator)
MLKQLSILLVLAPALAFAASEAEKLKQLQQSLHQSKTKTEQLAGTITKNSHELEGLQDRASTIAKEVQEAERRLGQREQELTTVTRELKAVEADYETRRHEYGRTIRSLLKMRELPPTAYFAQPNNMQQMMRTAAIMELTSESLSKKAAELSGKIKLLNAIRTKVETTNRAVKNDQNRLKLEQAKLTGEVAKRQAFIKDLRGDYAAEQARLTALSKQAKTIQELIGKLDTTRPQATGLRTMSVAGGRSPLVGNVLHRFGEKKNANETWRGIVFKGRPGGTVVAPHDGEVVFTGPFRDYGPMVLLRHANGYISLLAGLGGVDVGLNQSVRSGEPLGRLPATGASELYVELREKSKPIDPARWFAKLPSSLASN